MGKRRGLADDLFDTLVLVPWWVSPVLAAVSYGLLRFLLPDLLSRHAAAPLAALSRGLAAVISLLVLVVGLAAEFKKWANRRRLDRTSGLADVHAMSWTEFEALVGEAYRRQGYVVEQTGNSGADGGVDLVLYGDGQKTLLQCKHWRTRRVGVKVVRELSGSMRDANAAHGIVVCYGTFTSAARAFAQRNDVALVGGAALAQLIAAVKKDRSNVAAKESRPLSACPEAAPGQRVRHSVVPIVQDSDGHENGAGKVVKQANPSGDVPGSRNVGGYVPWAKGSNETSGFTRLQTIVAQDEASVQFQKGRP